MTDEITYLMLVSLSDGLRFDSSPSDFTLCHSRMVT